MSDNTNFYPFDFKDVFSRYFSNVYEYAVGLQPNETEFLGASDWAFMTDFVVDHDDVSYFDKVRGKRLDPQPETYQ